MPAARSRSAPRPSADISAVSATALPVTAPRNDIDCAAAPLTLAELDAALSAIGGFEVRPLLAIAVSGGADSLALTLLADRWARRRDGAVWGVTVDHGLRPESAAEAQTVARWLAARAIPHAILTWTGDKPASGIQAAAREARYRLLTAWCREHHILHLLTAHHREDQAETHLIRRRAGSGPDGLAAMSAVRELPGCRLVRPLLAVPRARLAAFLAAEGQPFIDDSSNRNPAFERVRLRIAAAVGAPSYPHPNPPPLAGEGVQPQRLPLPPPRAGEGGVGVSPFAAASAIDALLALTRVYGAERVRRERALDALLAAAVGLHPAGFAVIDPGALAGDAEAAERLLGRVAACIGGARYPARRERLVRLRAALAAQPERARPLGGCRFVPWRGRILVLRELAAADPPLSLTAREGVLWDRRFVVVPAADAHGTLTLGYLGQSGLPARSLGEQVATSDIPPLAYPALPAFWDREGLAAVPHAPCRRPGVGPLPVLFWRPPHALTQPGFTVV